MMRPRISISDEAMCWVVSALEEQASEHLDAEVVRHPWVALMLERSKKDDESDRYPIVCRDGMAPIVVACIRAGAKAADAGDWDIKRELQRVASRVKKDYGVEDVPTMRQALPALAKHGYLRVPSPDDCDSAGVSGMSGSPPFAGFPRWVVILGTAIAVASLISGCVYVAGVLID